MSQDHAAAREDVILQLMKRVGDLEVRLGMQGNTKNEKSDCDIEALETKMGREWTASARGIAIAILMGALLFLVSFWTFLTLGVRARH
ncbi:hypothetical protein ONS95_001880 [Cadophora gregata]|uniref:uncharacterized protein n=1 Tax=Cadophora gregata TaxID=51156 RepID=UPI0026DA979F|nr:uncharacterized protein ONS95_001880 [Cadophora gregata]KAK0111526.1 hypothetical protein ONS95_001880 [Cadophora gregata]KAK0111998.1 hypothetical protein ONS96_001260 [Cadophora gregata f. sp. sojae]